MNPTPSPDYMILDEVVYIHQMPHIFTLSNGVPLDLDLIGILSFTIQDSLFIITTKDEEGMWSFFGLPEYNYIGKYLTQGRGPNEFYSPPPVKDQYFFVEQNQLFSVIYEFNTGKSYKMNINETIKMNKLSIRETNYSLPRVLFGLSIIDTTTFLCKEVNDNATQQKRHLLRGNERKSSKNLEKLNRASIYPGEDINILSTGMIKNPDGSRIVETGVFLNHINLYSLDDSFGKTICMGKQIDNINNIQQTDKWDRIRRYTNPTAYKDFFSVIYINDTYIKFQQGTAKNPVIQFFDWDGSPLAEVKVDRMITSCVIDFIYGNLYTMNYNTEEIYIYDFQEILDKILHP